MATPTITLIGLGPGDPMLLTRAAWEALNQADIIYTPVPEHPALAEFQAHVALANLEDYREWDHVTITNHALDGANVCCAFLGSPYDWPAKLDMLDGYGCELQVILGVSLSATFIAALNQSRNEIVSIGNIAQIFTVEALMVNPGETFPRPRTSGVAAWCEAQNVGDYIPLFLPFPLLPEKSALIWDFARLTRHHDPLEVFRLRDLLLLHYPPEHLLRLVCLDAMGEVTHMFDVLLHQLHTHEAHINQRSALYVPPVRILEQRGSFNALHYIITRLLGPGGCPWDVQQTHQSLRANLLEETYEVLETLDSGDMNALSEELGDLLMQVLVHSEMARQAGHFDIGEVLEQISSKLIRRHPHVFSNVPVADEPEVLRNWERIKAQERAHKSSAHRSALDGIPAGLPALAAAQKAGGRAARAGFDWPTLELIWGKVHEELAELIQAHEEHTAVQSDTSRAHLAEELGDTLYVVVQLARWLDLDAESALREATDKFRRRFQAVEQAARVQDISLHDLTLDQKLALWRAAKGQ